MHIKKASALIFVWLLLITMVAPFGTRAQSPNNSSDAARATKRKMNVLFIAVDDLKPLIGAYGAPIIKTPNIDALAKSGLLFNRAYCQQAVCSPSRTSLLTGRRPDTTRIYDLKTHFRTTIPDVLTLPEHFKQQGYHTQSFGKVFHGGLDDKQSWSAPSTRPRGGAQNFGEGGRLSASWRALDVADNALDDGWMADNAIAALRKIKDKPFFLAAGFLKPHLPFIAPQKYYDLYPFEKISLANNSFAPKDAPPFAVTDFGELRRFGDIPKGNAPLSEAKARELIRGYYAATSYTDAQIGRVINELDRLGLRDNTIIVLWGDHGWHLGEHGMWTKHTNFEVATRAPLILSYPGQLNRGAKTDALVEFVDIYPTLSELAGLPRPTGLEGTSFMALFEKPNQQWKRAAFSQYPRSGGNQSPHSDGIMGYSMRTDRYRYTEWLKTATKKLVAAELYDHKADPDENINIANRAENRALVAQLSKQLQDGWRKALPSSVATQKSE